MTYVAIVVLAYRRQWPIRRLVLALFAFRSIGQAGFLVSGNELIPPPSPNFLEPLFLVAASLLAWQRTVRHRSDWQHRAFAVLDRYRWPIGAAIVVYKLVDEYITHVGKIDRSDLIRQLLGQ